MRAINTIRMADEDIQICPRCNIAWETISTDSRNIVRSQDYYYLDFPSYGKKTRTCPRCDLRTQVKRAHERTNKILVPPSYYELKAAEEKVTRSYEEGAGIEMHDVTNTPDEVWEPEYLGDR